MPSRYEKHGPTLIELGYDITPVVGKKPVLKGWSDRPDTAHDCAAHGDKSIGVLLGGKHNLVAVDVDILNPFAANDLEKLIEEELGSAPKRIGLSPKFLMVFRCTELQRKHKTGVYAMGDGDAAVEILGEGQQFVASGIHPDTKKKYYWPGDNLTEYRPQDLTEVTPDAIRRFLARASSIMSVYGPLKGRVSDRPSQPRGGLNLKELTADEGEILAALAHIPNNDEHYDDWVQTAHAIKGALGDDGYDMFCRWSARSDKDDPAQNERLWRSIGKVTSVGAGSIFHWAGEHGFDLQEVREGAEKEEQAAPPDPSKNPYMGKILTTDQLAALPPPAPLIDGMIFKNTIVNVFGPPATYKSFLAIDMALSIAHGRPWSHRKVAPGAVLYIAAEGGAGISKRVKAWRKHHEISSNSRFTVLPMSIDGRDKAHAQYLVDAMKSAADEMPVLVVIDTLARSFGGGDENSGQDMGQFIEFCEAVQRGLDGATIMIIHHAGKDTTRGARGHSSLFAAVDTEFELKRSQGTQIVRIKNSKQKDAEEAPLTAMTAVSVNLTTLGLDGETSLVLVDAGAVKDDVRERKAPSGKHQRVILGVLKKALKDVGFKKYIGDDRNVLCVPSDVLRKRAFLEMASQSKHRSTDYDNAIETLQRDGHLQHYNEYFWI